MSLSAKWLFARLPKAVKRGFLAMPFMARGVLVTILFLGVWIVLLQILEPSDRSRVQGPTQATYKCATSTKGQTIISLNNGATWQQDDGRCQKRRDEDAGLNSYWPTTLRVDTNMDSFWLPGEERTCQSYPDDSGGVSLVTCPASESHATHNIPVKFWGGVNRGIVSDWKCRREKDLLDDQFVCRAVD